VTRVLGEHLRTMRYKCKTMNIASMPVTYTGFVFPLCESCKTLDCSNPIEKKKVSLLGVNKEVRVYAKGQEVNFVIGCEGYLNDGKKN
jgi:hypothetical protein